jgi:hypothetical protein
VRLSQASSVTSFTWWRLGRGIALPRTIEGLAQLLLGIVSGTFIAMFAATGVLRAVYPYPIDGLEPGALQEVGRVIAGQPLYVAPSLQYVPQIYGPVYFYLAAPLAVLSGSAQFALRATSLLASLGSIAILFLLVRRETGNLVMGLFAGALLSTCNQLVEGAMDIGRTDAMALFLLLATTYVTCTMLLDGSRTSLSPALTLTLSQGERENQRGWSRSALGGCLLGLALLTKQTGLPVALALVLCVLVIRRGQLVVYIAALVLTAGVGFGLLLLQSGGWPFFYLWELPRMHQILPELMWRIWGDIVARFAPAILIGPLFLVGCAARGERGRLLFYSAVPCGMFVMAWASQATIRGARNVELPVYAALALLGGLGLSEALSWIGTGSRVARAGSAYAMVAAIGGLLVLMYNPRFLVPYRSDGWAGDRLAARLSALPGPIFAGGYQGYVRGVAGADAPDLEAVVEMQGEQVRPSTQEGDEWSGALAGAIVGRRYTYLIVNPDVDGFIVPQLATIYGYIDVGPLFPSGDIYWSWRTGWAPKAEVYARPGLGLPPPQ